MPKTTLLGDAQTAEPPTIGSRLRIWRRSLGKTQIEMCEELDVDVSTLRKYELGVNGPGSHFLTKAVACGLNVNWVLSGEGTMFKPQASMILSGNPAEKLVALADAMAVLYQKDEGKFLTLVNGFTARAQEATRLAELERETAVKAQFNTPAEAQSATQTQAGVGSALVPTDSEFADLIKVGRPASEE